MAGGRWTAQNKVRPGAYINFESVPAPQSSVGTRGIMTMPVPMTWGPTNTLISVYSTDLLNGASLAKIGLTAFDPESLIYREALANAYLALIFRVDSGGAKATATLGDLSVSALYPGTTGNKISVAIQANAANPALFDVITYLDGNEKDRQTIDSMEKLAANAWVEFSGTGAPSATAGTTLTGGANGTITPATYTTYFSLTDQAQWNTMALPNSTPTVKEQVVQYIKNKRENTGRKCQAVLVDYPTADYEGIISINQGYKNLAEEIIDAVTFTATVAGMTAAAEINQSNTFRILNNAVEITNPIADEDVEAALKNGQFILTRRQDGGIVVEQDINTLHNFTPYHDYQFSKNRVIRVLDDIGNQILVKFERAYIGKVDNNDQGRSVFRADVISYMNELQELGAIQNFDPQNDIKVGQGMEISAVTCELWVQPVDAMEKLYMVVNVGGES